MVFFGNKCFIYRFATCKDVLDDVHECMHAMNFMHLPHDENTDESRMLLKVWVNWMFVSSWCSYSLRLIYITFNPFKLYELQMSDYTCFENISTNWKVLSTKTKVNGACAPFRNVEKKNLNKFSKIPNHYKPTSHAHEKHECRSDGLQNENTTFILISRMHRKERERERARRKNNK